MTDSTEFYNKNSVYPDSKRGLGNDNWVCFGCRRAVRLSKGVNHSSKCSHCGRQLYCCGSKIKIPNKTKIKQWKKLEKLIGYKNPQR